MQKPKIQNTSFSEVDSLIRDVLPETNIRVDTVALNSNAEEYYFKNDTILVKGLFPASSDDSAQQPVIHYKGDKWYLPFDVKDLSLGYLLHVSTITNNYLIFILYPGNCNGSFCSITEAVIINTSGGVATVSNRYATPRYLLDYNKDGELDILLMKPQRPDIYEKFTMYLYAITENNDSVGYFKNAAGDSLKFSFEMDSTDKYVLTKPLNN